MEDFKNIIALLNSPETMELGATLAVSQGLDQKVLSFYKAKRIRQNYKKRDFFLSSKNSSDNYMFYVPKVCEKRIKLHKFSKIRNKYSDIIFHINEAILSNLNS